MIQWLHFYYLKRGLPNIRGNVGFKVTYDFLITLQFNRLLCWLNTTLYSRFVIYQTHLTRLKKDQLSYINRVFMQTRFLIRLDYHSIHFKNLRINSVSGFLIHFKGRMGNLRQVRSRFYKTNNISYAKHLNSFFFSCDRTYFTTKWGSMSLRIHFNYNPFYQKSILQRH